MAMASHLAAVFSFTFCWLAASCLWLCRVEGTRRAQLLTKAQLSKSIFSGGGESPGEPVPMDASGEGDGHNGGADLCPAMRDLAITADLLRRVGPETIAEYEGRTLASFHEADKERTHIAALLSARIEAAEKEVRGEDAEFAETVGSVEEGQRTIDRVVADLVTFDGQITLHCNQIRDTLAEQREHRLVRAHKHVQLTTGLSLCIHQSFSRKLTFVRLYLACCCSGGARVRGELPSLQGAARTRAAGDQGCK